MSRTQHVTRGGKRPHRQRAPARLTMHRDYQPYEQRPDNAGGSRRPSGGYAKDRERHALLKKMGRRLARRRRKQQEQRGRY